MINNKLVLVFLKTQDLNIDDLDSIKVKLDKGSYYTVSQVNKDNFAFIYENKNKLSNLSEFYKNRLTSIITKIDNSSNNDIIILTYILKNYAYQFYCDLNLNEYFGAIKITNLNEKKVEILIQQYLIKGLENSYEKIKKNRPDSPLR